MFIVIELYFAFTLSYKNKKYVIAFYGKILSQVKTSSWTVACKESNQGHSFLAILMQLIKIATNTWHYILSCQLWYICDRIIKENLI